MHSHTFWMHSHTVLICYYSRHLLDLLPPQQPTARSNMLLSFIITTPYITPFHTTPHHIISHNITLHFTSHNTPFVTTLFSLLHTPTTPTPPPSSLGRMLQMWRGVQPVLSKKVVQMGGTERFEAAVKHAQKLNFCHTGGKRD